MKYTLAVAAVGLMLSLLAACGSDDTKSSDNRAMEGTASDQSSSQMYGGEADTSHHMAMGETSDLPSKEEWVRSSPIDVKKIDENHDGLVYQDMMDWNVVADQEGKCPKCGMILKEVTVDKAEKNLQDHGFKTVKTK